MIKAWQIRKGHNPNEQIMKRISQTLAFFPSVYCFAHTHLTTTVVCSNWNEVWSVFFVFEGQIYQSSVDVRRNCKRKSYTFKNKIIYVHAAWASHLHSNSSSVECINHTALCYQFQRPEQIRHNVKLLEKLSDCALIWVCDIIVTCKSELSCIPASQRSICLYPSLDYHSTKITSVTSRSTRDHNWHWFSQSHICVICNLL